MHGVFHVGDLFQCLIEDCLSIQRLNADVSYMPTSASIQKYSQSIIWHLQGQGTPCSQQDLHSIVQTAPNPQVKIKCCDVDVPLEICV